MGFAPDIPQPTSEWLSSTGQQQFLQIVQRAVRDRAGTDVEIADPQELIRILENTIRIRGDSRDILREVVTYCVQMCLGRLRLDNRLQSIRDNPIRNICRGGYDREKGCLPMADQRQSLDTSYHTFLQAQHKYRD